MPTCRYDSSRVNGLVQPTLTGLDLTLLQVLSNFIFLPGLHWGFHCKSEILRPKKEKRHIHGRQWSSHCQHPFAWSDCSNATGTIEDCRVKGYSMLPTFQNGNGTSNLQIVKLPMSHAHFPGGDPGSGTWIMREISSPMNLSILYMEPRVRFCWRNLKKKDALWILWLLHGAVQTWSCHSYEAPSKTQLQHLAT